MSEVMFSAVTIIVVTIFIATFQNYRIVKDAATAFEVSVAGGLRGPSRLYDVTAHNYQCMSTLSLSR